MYLDQKQSNFSLNIRGQLLRLDTPKVMGILNITPDSFFDGGEYYTMNDAILQCQKMVENQVDIIDVGAMSTRPNSKKITAEDELVRLKNTLPALIKEFDDSIFSIDTYHSEVARFALDSGVHIVNDISGGSFDATMWSVVAQYKVPYIAMHIQGTPQTMQSNPNYEDVCADVYNLLAEKKELAYKHGVNDLILDPGFGFGKTTEQNYSMLKHLDYFQNLQCPILVGLSRKSMLYKPLNLSPDDVLHLTSSLHLEALRGGANILRVHDVKEAKEVIAIYQLYHNAQ